MYIKSTVKDWNIFQDEEKSWERALGHFYVLKKSEFGHKNE